MRYYDDLFDVAIIGGGYLGIVLALMLAPSGRKICIVESNKFSKKLEEDEPGRLFAISFGSLEILKRFHVIDFKDLCVQTINGILVFDGNSKVEFNPGDLGLDYFGCMVQEHDLMSTLLKRVRIFENVLLLDSTKLVDIVEDDYGIVSCSLNDIRNNSKSVLRASCVIATDGKCSSIRKMLKLKTHRKSYEQSAIVFDILHKHSHCGIAVEKFFSSGPLAILPKVGEHSSSIVWTLSEGAASAVLSLSKNSIIELLSAKIPEFGELQLDSRIKSFPLSLQKAEDYYDRNIVFVGDALHTIHPLAGQGLNLGLRDAAVLCDIILQNFRVGLDAVAFDAFSRYEAERKSDVFLMMFATDFLNNIFSNDIASLKMARKICMSVVNNISLLRSVFLRYATYGLN